eukprot:762128-Hanusia_phi.AAC.5
MDMRTCFGSWPRYVTCEEVPRSQHCSPGPPGRSLRVWDQRRAAQDNSEDDELPVEQNEIEKVQKMDFQCYRPHQVGASWGSKLGERAGGELTQESLGEGVIISTSSSILSSESIECHQLRKAVCNEPGRQPARLTCAVRSSISCC